MYDAECSKPPTEAKNIVKGPMLPSFLSGGLVAVEEFSALHLPPGTEWVTKNEK
jgi:hypothetical protein